MNVTVQLHDGPIIAPIERTNAGAGAVVMFEGIVRMREQGRGISALDYHVYDPMAERELKRLADLITREFDLLAVTVMHSRGIVSVGQCSFRLVVAARHRKPALAAMDWFIDALKRDVPIWKHPIWATDSDIAAGEHP